MDNMANHIAQIICETDLPNSNGFGTVRLNKKEAEILATKLAAGIYPQGENVKDLEEQLKTEKAKYDFAVTAYRNVLAELERAKNEYDALKYSDPKYTWHKTKDGEFPDKEVLCCCEDENGGRLYSLGTYDPTRVDRLTGKIRLARWKLDFSVADIGEVIAWTEIPEYV